MVQKKNIQPLGTPSDDGSFSKIQPVFESYYKSRMDSSFAALGRNVTLHLRPEIIADTSGIQASTNALQYNPFMGRAPRRAPSDISTTRSGGTQYIHRDVVYVAHIKHGPRDSDDTGGVVLSESEVQTTTVLASSDHIDECESATIDGSRYALESKKIIGFQDARYVICKWSAVNEQEA